MESLGHAVDGAPKLLDERVDAHSVSAKKTQLEGNLLKDRNQFLCNCRWLKRVKSESTFYLHCGCTEVKYGHFVKQGQKEWVATEDGRCVHVIL